MGSKAGRPTKWSEELEEKALHYIENFNTEEYGDAIPSIVGLAVALNVAKSTIYEWGAEERGIFPDILEACNTNQERTLVNGGITGAFNPTIVKLILTKHGYQDQAHQTLSGPDGGPIETKSHPLVVQPVRIVEKDSDSGG